MSSEDGLTSADKIFLPGVGAFDWVMERLAASGDPMLTDLMDGQAPAR